jgi:hypothetical protein
MGKRENLYLKEYIIYYKNLGIDKIFIYDDNDPNIEKMMDVLNNHEKKYVEIFEKNKYNFKFQNEFFTFCYETNKDDFDWFLMLDVDEFLYIINDNLKHYLSDKMFTNCDFIKIHWLMATDNGLIYYDNRTLFERFKEPYIKYVFIKSIIKGGIQNLKYGIHSPSYSPKFNRSCNNIGEIINKPLLNFESIDKINIDKAYILHFRYKSTEEFIERIKKGYRTKNKEILINYLHGKMNAYLRDNYMNKKKEIYLKKNLI